PDAVSEGTYYLLKTDESKSQFPSDAREIKRYSDSQSIVVFSKDPEPEFLKNTTLFQVSPDWKLAPELLKALPEKNLLLSVRTLDAEEFKTSSPVKGLQAYQDYFIIEASPKILKELLQHDQVIHIAEYKVPKAETQVSVRD